jgi:hypothetical protein
MNLEHTMLSMLLTMMLLSILLPLVCFVVVLLLLKFAAKLKWLTAICLSVFAVTIISILGISTHFGMKIGPVFLLPAVVCGVIMVIQFFRWIISSDNASVNTAERNRILKMVEDGKIGTEEGTELLDAMGRSSALQGQDKFSRLDIAILVGVALVILGFFLPWAYLGHGMYQAGHHRGPIGWAVLIVAVFSAVPIFVTPKDLLYKISMLQIFLILVGLALVIKELAVGADQAGSIFCAGGFVVAFFGSVIKLKSLAA